MKRSRGGSWSGWSPGTEMVLELLSPILELHPVFAALALLIGGAAALFATPSAMPRSGLAASPVPILELGPNEPDLPPEREPPDA